MKALSLEKTNNIMLFVLFVSLPFQWITLIKIGGLSVKTPHVMVLAIVAIYFVAYPGSIRRVIRPNVFYVSYALGQSILLLSLYWSSQPGNGIREIVRDSSYVVLSYLVFLWVARIPALQIIRTGALAMAATIPAFIVFVYVSMKLDGNDLFAILKAAAVSGDPTYIQYHVFFSLFNNGNPSAADGDGFSSAARHSVMLAILFEIICYVVWRGHFSGGKRVALDGFAMIGFITILTSLSRSAILCTLLSLAVYVCSGIYSGRIHIYRAIFFVIFSVFMVSSFYYSDYRESVEEILYGRFVEDVVNNPRARDFEIVLDNIAASPWIGSGAGVRLSGDQLAATEVHNFVLHYWYQSGLIGFYSAITTMLILLYFLAGNFITSLRERDDSTYILRIVCAMLIVVPIIRLNVAGGGSISLSEWISISVTFAIIRQVGLLRSDGRAPLGSVSPSRGEGELRREARGLRPT